MGQIRQVNPSDRHVFVMFYSLNSEIDHLSPDFTLNSEIDHLSPDFTLNSEIDYLL